MSPCIKETQRNHLTIVYVSTPVYFSFQKLWRFCFFSSTIQVKNKEFLFLFFAFFIKIFNTSSILDSFAGSHNILVFWGYV